MKVAEVKVVPFSSVVGSSLTLHDETGKVVAQVSFLNTGSLTASREEWKQSQIDCANFVADAIRAESDLAALKSKLDEAVEALRPFAKVADMLLFAGATKLSEIEMSGEDGLLYDALMTARSTLARLR